MIKIRNTALITAFGERVRNLRQQKGLTIENLSAMANIEYRQLSDVERGKTNATISTAHAIAKALDVELGKLFEMPGF